MKLLEAWREFEQEKGSAGDVAKVNGMMPQVVRKKRTDDAAVGADDDVGKCSPAYAPLSHDSSRIAEFDYVFPDDLRESNPASFKFLEMAHKWKMQQAKAGAGAGAATAQPAEPSAASASRDVAMEKDVSGDADGDSDMASSDEE